MDTKSPASKQLARRDFIKYAGLAATVTALSPSLTALGQASAPVTLAMVGCAHIHTPSYVDILSKRPDVKVKYLWDYQPDRAKKYLEKLNGEVVDDPKKIWSDPEVKGVVICSETNRHHDLILAAAAAGKHMFAEKPLGITAKESWEMAEAIEKAKLLFTTGYFMRVDPAHLFIKEQIAKGTLGKITRVRASNCHSGSLGGWFDTDWRWMADLKQAGVGAFGDLGTHMLDILMWMMGDVASITANIKVVTGRYGDCDESGEALIEFKNGVTGTLGAGWVDVDDPVTLLVSGTEGLAYVNRGRVYIKTKHLEDADGKQPWTELPKALPVPMHQFVDAVSGKTGLPLVTPREAAARVSVMEAAYKGAHGKTWETPT